METRDEYAARMRKSRQFRFFGIEPVWRPGERDVEGFCHDEVVRQFHDPRDWHDGGRRIEQMMSAWEYAQRNASFVPGAVDVLKLGALVEPEYNSTPTNPHGEFRHENVEIGGRLGAPPPYLRELISALCSRAGDAVPGPSDSSLPNRLDVVSFKQQLQVVVLTVDDWYLAYEWIHPFRDGNGRTGKILHNWLNGTLDDPVLVADYFGGGNP